METGTTALLFEVLRQLFQFIDFVSRCLVKKSEERATASELLQHDFIKNAKSPGILAQMISEAQQMRDQLQDRAFVSIIFRSGH